MACAVSSQQGYRSNTAANKAKRSDGVMEFVKIWMRVNMPKESR